MEARAYYFGCGAGAGHFWWAPCGRPTVFQRVRVDGIPPGCPWGYEVDGGVQPGSCRTERQPWRNPDDQTQGPCTLRHRDGWTLIGWWDRSVDKRGGCCSAFALEGTHDFDAMLVELQARFPWVVARLTFPLTLSTRQAAG